MWQFVINGDLVDAIDGGTFATLDPRSGDKILDVADGTRQDVDKAVESSRKAFDEGAWPKMGGKVLICLGCNLGFLSNGHIHTACSCLCQAVQASSQRIPYNVTGS